MDAPHSTPFGGLRHPVLTQARLKELLSYDANTGIFTRNVSVCPNAMKGMEVGAYDAYGYRQVRLDNKVYKCHRLAWLYVYGKWPDGLIDHINSIRDDNRIINLREATKSQNGQNILKGRSDSISGLLGAHWSNQRQKWFSRIKVKEKTKYLGFFNTPEEAHRAYIKAKREHHEYNML